MIYNTTRSGNAENLIFNQTMSKSFLTDYIIDVTAINDTLAWTCNYGFLIGSIEYLYNGTSNTLGDDTLDTYYNACKSIYYMNNNDLLILHQGVNYVRIFNSTNRTIISSISISGASSTGENDLVSHSNNYLFILSNYNEVKKYDLTDPANPSLIASCRTDRDIQSIEAMNDNEVIIGATNKIGVCDFNNSETYYAAGGYYVAETLRFIPNEYVYEISKNNAQNS